MLRYSVYDTMGFVSLDKEINHVKEYMHIQNYRYPNKYELLINDEDGLEGIMILKLILQPIIENAIKHGLDDQVKGKIKIDIRKQSQEVCLSVSDNGKGMDSEQLDFMKAYLKDSSRKDDSHSIGLKKCTPKNSTKIWSELRTFY